MKYPTPLTSLFLLSAASVSARWSLPSVLDPTTFAAREAADTRQMPLTDIIPGLQGNSQEGPSPSGLVISDVLGRERSINIFAGFVREIEQVSSRLDDKNKNSTILAPLNSQIEKLPQKPWEDPADYSAMGAQAYEGADGEGRAHRNLRRFVEAHVVSVSPWTEGSRERTVSGREIWWEMKDGRRFVGSKMPAVCESGALTSCRSSQTALRSLTLPPKFQMEKCGSCVECFMLGRVDRKRVQRHDQVQEHERHDAGGLHDFRSSSPGQSATGRAVYDAVYDGKGALSAVRKELAGAFSFGYHSV